MPPFGRIVRLIARGADETATHEYLQKLAALWCRLGRCQGVRVGPAPRPIIKIRGLYRFHLQARCSKAGLLQSLMRDLPARLPPPQGIELAIDVDPISML